MWSGGTQAAVYTYLATVYTTLGIRPCPTRPPRPDSTPGQVPRPGQAWLFVRPVESTAEIHIEFQDYLDTNCKSEAIDDEETEGTKIHGFIPRLSFLTSSLLGQMLQEPFPGSRGISGSKQLMTAYMGQVWSARLSLCWRDSPLPAEIGPSILTLGETQFCENQAPGRTLEFCL